MIIEILIYLSLGAFTGLLAGMFGIGGGSILVPSLIFIFYGMGFESSIIFLMAIGTSLASIFFSAISSALSHHKKRSVEWPLVIPLSIGMILGAVLGAGYAATLTNENLKWIIITSNNAEEVFKKLEEQGIDPVLWGLTDKDFELLAKNFARIRNQLKVTNDLLDKYKEYYEEEDVKDGE